MVEQNFSPSHKQEWPDYVKSIFIRRDLDDGLNTADIARKYNWGKRKVEETKKIIHIIDDFCGFAQDDIDLEDEFGGGLGLSEAEAEKIAADNYHFFNEAQKSFYKELESDINFKISFYKWIYKKKFASFPEVRIAYDAWTDSEARSVLLSDEPGAAKEAKAILDYQKRVIKGKTDAKKHIEDFVKFLEGLTMPEIQGIPESTIDKMNNALSIVAKMAEATK